MKLKELHINNFKFFPKQDPKSPLLKIDGKNLLIYGENGSGKSTIYWALYTLLESSFKKTDADVAKYFEYRGQHGLVNIHAARLRHNTFIKAVLVDGVNTKDYLVSGNMPAIQAIRADSDVRESGMASEFINYKILHGLHQARNSVENNLFEWFAHEILPYIRTQSTLTFEEVFTEIKKGPRQVQDLAGDTIFAHAALRTDPDPGMQSNFRFYRAWDNKANRWKNELARFLRSITIRANQILQQDFQQNIEFKLEFTPPRYNVVGTAITSPNDLTNLNWHEPQIVLKIVRYRGTPNAVKKAHSFLNEAKWTAIGLSIRLAILEDTTYRPSPVDLKCLVMDDMLLSLDMSNRDIVLNVLLERYVNDYQLILLTHDKYFYELTKRKINAYSQKDKWLNIEMFEDDTGRFPKPFIRSEKDGFTTAKDYVMAHDYVAASIYLRKELESILTTLMPPQFCKYEKVEDGITKFVDYGLNDLILSFGRFCVEDEIDYTPFINLKVYKDILLNPLAHNDIEMPIFHNETLQIIELIEKLKLIKRAKTILQSGRNLNFSLINPDATFFSVRMRTQERLLLMERPNEPPKISIFSKCRVTSTSNNGVIDNTQEQFNSVKEAYLEMCTRFNFQPAADISRVFTYDGQTFDQQLIIINTP